VIETVILQQTPVPVSRVLSFSHILITAPHLPLMSEPLPVIGSAKLDISLFSVSTSPLNFAVTGTILIANLPFNDSYQWFQSALALGRRLLLFQDL